MSVVQLESKMCWGCFKGLSLAGRLDYQVHHALDRTATIQVQVRVDKVQVREPGWDKSRHQVWAGSTGGKPLFTHWVHGEFIVGSETICPPNYPPRSPVGMTLGTLWTKPLSSFIIHSKKYPTQCLLGSLVGTFWKHLLEPPLAT